MVPPAHVFLFTFTFVKYKEIGRDIEGEKRLAGW